MLPHGRDLPTVTALKTVTRARPCRNLAWCLLAAHLVPRPALRGPHKRGPFSFFTGHTKWGPVPAKQGPTPQHCSYLQPAAFRRNADDILAYGIAPLAVAGMPLGSIYGVVVRMCGVLDWPSSDLIRVAIPA